MNKQLDADYMIVGRCPYTLHKIVNGDDSVWFGLNEEFNFSTEFVEQLICTQAQIMTEWNLEVIDGDYNVSILRVKD